MTPGRRRVGLRAVALAAVVGAGCGLAHAAPFEDSMAQRVLACTGCHGQEGRAGPDGYYPRIAGKPAGYLANQLLNFRDGRRHYGLMNNLVSTLSDAYLAEIAAHFASLEVAYPAPAPSRLDAAQTARAERLVTDGDRALGVPACTACHGAAMTGVAPFVPGLLGLPRDYLVAQLGAWRSGKRVAQSPDCMHDVAVALSQTDVEAMAGWLASHPVPADAKAAPGFRTPPPKACGGVNVRAVPAATGATNPGTPEVTTRAGRVAWRVAVAGVLVLAALAALVAWLNVRGEAPLDDGAGGAAGASPAATDAETLARGAYLVRAGNCGGCHTERGGAPFAGGRAIETPFGTVFSSNLTPHPTAGLGAWSAAAFWRALHHGRSKDGRLLYPAFPYPNYTRVTRADADAMFAWLRTLPSVARPPKPHALDFPYGTQAALAVWRALFFRPAEHVDDPARGAAWNRGAYLVEGLGHCNACHSARNALGATAGPLDLQGGLIPVQNWYAPSLASPHEAGVADWPDAEVVRLLKTGIAERGVVMGPMAEVVLESTQHLSDADLVAIATYLKRLPAPPAGDAAPAAAPIASARGGALYRDHCAGCHGTRGEGVAGAYPALAGNRAVTMRSVANLVHAVLEGGFPPATAGNPRPYGMPPFATVLSDADLAELLSFVRASWGNGAPAVSALDVAKARDGPR